MSSNNHRPLYLRALDFIDVSIGWLETSLPKYCRKRGFVVTYRHMFVSVLAAVVLFPNIACAAAIVENLQLSGLNLSCTSSSGRLVPLIISDDAIAIGGGGYATTNATGSAIMLSPTYLNSLTKEGAVFLFYHECAHVALPMGVGLGTPSQEANADCYAVMAMQRHGLINSVEGLKSALSVVRDLPASRTGHRPGAEREAEALKCITWFKGNDTSEFCETIEGIMTGGPNYVANLNPNNRRLFDNFTCNPRAASTTQGAAVACKRELTDGAEVDKFHEMSKLIRSCLPPTFKFKGSSSLLRWLYIDDSKRMIYLDGSETGILAIEVIP